MALLPYRIPDETGLSPCEVHKLVDFVWTWFLTGSSDVLMIP